MITTHRFLRTAVARIAARLATRLAAVAAVLAAGLGTVLAAAPAAFATEVPAPPADGGAARPAGPVPVHTVVVGGTPGWQIALLAVGAAVLAAAAAVLVDRALRARRAAPRLGRGTAG